MIGINEINVSGFIITNKPKPINNIAIVNNAIPNDPYTSDAIYV